MTPSDDEPHLGPEARAMVDVARRTLGTMSLQQRSRGLARVSARLENRRGVRISPWAIAGVGAVVLASLALAGRSLLRPAGPPVLSYAIEGGAVDRSGSVRGAVGVRPHIRFSDGTEIAIGEAGRAHVSAVTEHGATVAVDEGDVHARVVHWAGSRWLFDAGPFVVTVTGTEFTLAWTPSDERLDLRLENGSVEVSSPISDHPIALRSGQWLTVLLRPREVLIRDLPGHDAPPAAPPAATSAAPIAPPPTSEPQAAETAAPVDRPPAASEAPAIARSAEAPAATKRDWAAMLASGKLEDIVSDAEQRGIGSCLADASSNDLSVLADAARYTKRIDLSKRALLAQRQRFGGSRRAAEAAFLLGRIAESQEGPASALKWFERYLAEAPAGAYASEALGRRMALVEKTSGRAAAATIAEEYLRRFPKGTYARAAQAILRSP